MLAVLLMNPKITTEAVAERLLSDVMSWDLCDHLCKNLFLKMECRMQEPQLYKKRAAFVLIAASVIHDKKLENDMVDGYLELIMRYADDEREHARKCLRHLNSPSPSFMRGIRACFLRHFIP
ncbi:hypothetical protein [Enterocloster clostridioformis]|uniref:hypothetical protein n=1 Tax=Enterocloster clostridioformis TaxID=1531 RepID=UPI003B514FBE